ncbi:MAG: nitroreductase family protein [Clostridia bacterium]|nr:nitroreductase family protein [Clostridia bacterium]
MNETIKLLMERKSVRQFVMEKMPKEDVRTILEAAVQAPTAGNKSLWTAIHVTDPDKKAALAKSCDNQPFIATAPLVLVFCADYKRWFDMYKTLDLGEELRVPGEGDFLLAAADTFIAAHASVVAADALGYGSCYIGDIVENCDIQREILGLPEYVKPVCMAVYGRPTQSQIDRKKPPRFKVEDLVHENTYKAIDAQEMVDMIGERQGLEGEALDRWLLAFCKRKWNCDFSREMTRSAAQMISEWCEGK